MGSSKSLAVFNLDLWKFEVLLLTDFALGQQAGASTAVL
jgi:hypothetical protein